MIAALTRSMIALQLIVLAGLAMALVEYGDMHWLPALLLTGALMLSLRAAIIVNNYVLSAALRQPVDNGRPAPILRLAARVGQEYGYSMLCWFRLLPTGRPFFVQAGDRGQPPVLLLHGYGANSGFWRSFSRRLRHAGISHAAIDLEPVLADIDDYAPLITEAVDRLCRECGSTTVILLGHSMGGLAARAWLRACGSMRVLRVITLGTPHHGSTLAGYGMGINARQMLPPAGDAFSWLGALAASEDAARRALFVSIYSRHDNIVSPQESAMLPGATNVALDLVGHVALGFDASVGERVLAEIISARRSRSTAENR